MRTGKGLDQSIALGGVVTTWRMPAAQAQAVGEHADGAEGHGRGGHPGLSRNVERGIERRRRREECRQCCSPRPRPGSGAYCAGWRGPGRAPRELRRAARAAASTSPASWARSAPVPMAMPASAWASAPASLMPSPTMPTRRPLCCSARMRASLPAGSSPASTSSMPACCAMGSAAAANRR